MFPYQHQPATPAFGHNAAIAFNFSPGPEAPQWHDPVFTPRFQKTVLTVQMDEDEDRPDLGSPSKRARVQTIGIPSNPWPNSLNTLVSLSAESLDPINGERAPLYQMDSTMTWTEEEPHSPLKEFIDTERQFISDLEVLADGMSIAVPRSEWMSNVDPREDIGEMLRVHRRLASGLQGVGVEGLIACFEATLPQFAIYTRYIPTMSTHQSTLRTALETSPAFAQAVGKAFEYVHGKQMSVMEMVEWLHKPLQRVTKYVLLLQSVSDSLQDPSLKMQYDSARRQLVAFLQSLNSQLPASNVTPGKSTPTGFARHFRMPKFSKTPKQPSTQESPRRLERVMEFFSPTSGTKRKERDSVVLQGDIDYSRPENVEKAEPQGKKRRLMGIFSRAQ